MRSGTNPLDIAEVAKKAGWTVQPLKKGSKKDLTYSEGRGLSMNPPAGSGESLYIQYHPGCGHHGEYKVSSPKNGTLRIDLNGKVLK
ncbi:hypothetical protein [Listeria welshimeri]|uniref:hypothetical protein n=1 Tax=Listeria welshimeri TaxID=1643 RepID=UPI001627439E|nr:hypothetical protein [Listeria welshimeri]